jgi:hypothetical protein
MAPHLTTRLPSTLITIALRTPAVVAWPSNSHRLIARGAPLSGTARVVSSRLTEVPANTMYVKWAVMAYAIHIAHVNADPDGQPNAKIDRPITSVPVITQVTSVPSPTAPLSAMLPSQVPPPPPQAWCPSKIFCPGAVRHVISPCLVFDAHTVCLLAPANRQPR